MTPACPPWCTGRPDHPAALHWRDLGVINGPHLVTSLATLRNGREVGTVRVYLDDDQGVRYHDLSPVLAAAIGHAIAALDHPGVRELGSALTTGAGLLIMEGTS
ncbi:hypothetical protein [Microbispora sp. CSR-4]|uniref:hypothetical protein n=1 Tax=Microbispora sp. CSR-4 TaxID=2592813 RepID=UPI0011C93454|nr:hypothetical protein [Microbispora sp. CSR-4]